MKNIIKIIPYKFGLPNLIVILLQITYFILFQRRHGFEYLDFSSASFLFVFMTFLSINLLIQINSALFSKSKRIKIAIDCFLVIIFHQSLAYQLMSKSNIDFTLAKDNIDLLLYGGSMDVFISSMHPLSYFISIIIFCTMVFSEYKWKLLSTHIQTPPIIPKLLLSIPLYLLLIISGVQTGDNITYFFQSIIRYYFNDYNNHTLTIGSYPYYKTETKHKNNNLVYWDGKDKPNVIIIMIESFNGFFVENKSPEGHDFTPVFNSLIKDGIYVKHFYGNSIQTAKGQFAVLTSTLPTVQGKEFKMFYKTKFSSLPKILSDNGYNTLFYQAYYDINFDNTGSFMEKNGFKKALSADPNGPDIYSKKNFPKKNRLKWGIEDAELYRRFFSYADNNLKTDSHPFFTIIATVANHMDFDSLQKDEMFLYQNPKEMKENYSNSLYLSDKQLKVFLDEMDSRDWMKNTILIITGDHSYPVGDHGIINNEAGYFDDSFRIPFLLIWKNKIHPMRIENVPFSQLDIAPTIIDVLNLNNIPNSFQGKSIISFYNEVSPIYLVQPYSGKYLCVVNYPYKYIIHERNKKELLFNLGPDPNEKKDLSTDENQSDIINEMRKLKANIYINQKAIELDNIFYNDITE